MKIKHNKKTLTRQHSILTGDYDPVSIELYIEKDNTGTVVLDSIAVIRIEKKGFSSYIRKIALPYQAAYKLYYAIV